MSVQLQATAFKPWATLEAYEQTHVNTAKSGANCVFVGNMRDFNLGDTVDRLHIEHYPGMTEKELAQIIDEAQARWSLNDVLIIHRVGAIHPSEAIVLLACWSAHRKDAFEACRFLMEALKQRATFWKKERLTDSQTERWVSANTLGY